DRLHRGNRVAAGRGNPLLQQTHLVSEVRLVTHRRGHTAQQGGDLRTRLREAEDVVDEQKHVLLLHVAEVLRHGQRGQRDPQTGTRGLVHLPEDEGGVREDAHLLHLQEEVGALTGTLAHPGEHGDTTEVAGDTGDHLLDEHRPADTRTTEEADLTAAHVRGEQVDDLDTGDQHLGLRLELVEGRGRPVDRPVLLDLQFRLRDVLRLTQGVEHVPFDAVAHRNPDRRTGVAHLSAADQAVLRVEADGADQVVSQVLGDFERDGPGLPAEGDFGLQSVVDRRQGADGKLHVDDRADDPGDAAGHRCGCGRPFSSRSHFSYSLPALAAASASAPPTISLISLVISAWRAWLAWRVRVLTSSSALSVAAFIAARRDACWDAADSRRAK